jgi:hypothetical protein
MEVKKLQEGLEGNWIDSKAIHNIDGAEACQELSAFRDRGVPKPTSEMSSRAPAQMGRSEAEREGGKRGGRRWA